VVLVEVDPPFREEVPTSNAEIADPASLAPLGAVSKFNIEPEFLEHLFDLGRAAATAWLATAFDLVGVQSTLDIRARFL